MEVGREKEELQEEEKKEGKGKKLQFRQSNFPHSLAGCVALGNLLNLSDSVSFFVR